MVFSIFQVVMIISIHALLAESDPFHQILQKNHRYFYPRSPCGERPKWQVLDVQPKDISIHALLAESDPTGRFWTFSPKIFLSTLSLRRATQVVMIKYLHLIFLSTLSLRRATIRALYTCTMTQISIHALLAESDGGNNG